MIQPEWLWGLAGGGLIGLAGAMFLLVQGRVMGISGILGGLVGVPALYVWLQPGFTTQISSDLWVLLTGGFLVGLGTRLANGCTSGHGVCGISRLSRRGIAASAVYVGIGMVSVGLLRHVWGLV
jgi:uncharacterized protein